MRLSQPVRRWLAVVIATATGAAAAHAQSPAEISGEVRAWRADNELAILDEARSLLELPNNASDSGAIRANAALLVSMLEARGAEARILEAGESAPAVYGEITVPGADRTVLLYSHYDGQPVDPARWITDPFEPAIYTASHEAGGEPLDWDGLAAPVDPDARIYARSASDDKSPIVAMLAAIDALRANDRDLSVNVKFFFEGEEEAGSPHLAEMLETHADLLQSDVWILADGPVDPSGDPRVMLGVRGVTRFELTAYGPVSPLHSGHFGNVAPNPGARLAHLIASMRDEQGRILVEGLGGEAEMSDAARALMLEGAFDDEAMLAQAGVPEAEWGPDARYGEAISHTALNVLGLRMGPRESPPNAIQDEATAMIGVRLAPGVRLEDVREGVAAHVRAQGYHLLEAEPTPDDRLAHPRLARIRPSELGYEAAQTDPDHPLVARLIEIADGADPRPMRIAPLLGGSLPLAPIQDVLNTPFIIVPMVNADNNQHAPNENLRVGNLWYGVEVYAAVLALAGADGAAGETASGG